MFLSRNDAASLGRRSSRAVTAIVGIGPFGSLGASAPAVPLLLIMALVVLVLRLPFINFNVLNDDEAVYLMVGEALRHGSVPYVDVIDRKPIGIYLIYALADLVFRDAVIGARVLGAVSTFGAAVLLKWFGERALGLKPLAGAVCGLLYATYALLFFGDAAQTPVFFMPLVIAAAGLVVVGLKQMDEGAAPSPWRLGVAGLLLGASLQIKYSTVIECLMWGALPLLFAWWRRDVLSRKDAGTVFTGAGLMLLGGLFPTAVAFGVYAALGHGDAFLFYNFTVNLQRGPTQYPQAVILLRGCLFVLAMSPLVVMSWRFIRTRAVRGPDSSEERFDNRRWLHVVLVLWSAAAIFAGLMQRQPFSHYFFDALAPFSLLAAAALQWTARHRAAAKMTAVLFGLAIMGYVALRAEKIVEAGSPYLPQHVADEIQSRGIQSLYVFNSAGIIYHLAHMPLPSRYPHPPMLTSSLEAASFAIDAQTELKKILGENPGAIVLQQPISPQITADRQQLVLTKLAHDYCLWRTYDAGLHQRVELYVRRESRPGEAQLACALPPNAG